MRVGRVEIEAPILVSLTMSRPGEPIVMSNGKSRLIEGLSLVTGSREVATYPVLLGSWSADWSGRPQGDHSK